MIILCPHHAHTRYRLGGAQPPEAFEEVFDTLLQEK